MFVFADVRRKVTVMNELLALSLLISSMKDMYMYNMGSLYLLNPKNDKRFSNEIYVTCIRIGTRSVCSYLRMCGEKSQ